MSDESENNVSSIRPKLDPLKQMTSEEWGRELYKSYLISSLGLPPLAADHKASLASDALSHAISLVTLTAIREILKMEGEIEEEEIKRLNDNTRLKHTAEIIREEMVKQAEGIYFWDEADKDLFQGGDPEILEHVISSTPTVDRFDFEKIAKEVMK